MEAQICNREHSVWYTFVQPEDAGKRLRFCPQRFCPASRSGASPLRSFSASLGRQSRVWTLSRVTSWVPASIEPAIRNTARTTYHPPRLPLIQPRHTATSPLFRGGPEIPFRGDLLIPKVGNMSKCQLKAVYGVYGCMVL